MKSKLYLLSRTGIVSEQQFNTHTQGLTHKHTVQSTCTLFKVSSSAATSTMDVIGQDIPCGWLRCLNPCRQPVFCVWQFHFGLILLQGFRCLRTFPLLSSQFVHYLLLSDLDHLTSYQWPCWLNNHRLISLTFAVSQTSQHSFLGYLCYRNIKL